MLILLGLSLVIDTGDQAFLEIPFSYGFNEKSNFSLSSQIISS